MLDKFDRQWLISKVLIIGSIFGAIVLFWITLDEDMKRSIIYRIFR